MANLDVASLVGTWVAAIVALVALIGIIGPVLVWRASRTQRHQALATVGRNNNGFLSRGIHAGPAIYLLVQVKVPYFKNAPSLNHNFSIDATKLKYADSPSSWVNFASLLYAYNIHCGRGNHLVIEGVTTLLPVHRLWILGLGLVGRYGLRKGSERNEVIGERMTRRRLERRRRGSTSEDEGSTPRSTRENVFDGLTGSIRVRDRTAQSGETLGDVLIFEPRPIDELSNLCPDVLPLKCLFMLAFGCIPILGTGQSGQYLSLVREMEDPDDESSSDSEVDYDNRVHMSKGREHRKRSRWTDVSRRNHESSPPSRSIPDTYHIIQDTDRDQDRSEIFSTFRTGDDEIFKLAKFRPKPNLLAELEDYSLSTYVPSESQWIRTPPGSREEYSYTGSDNSEYILRADAQAMACSLLRLIWNPEGYLFPTKKFGLGVRLLTNVSHRLSPMMSRLIDGIKSLDISDSEQKPLIDCLPLLRRNLQTYRIQPTRKYWKRLVALDTELESLGQRDGRKLVELMIGVLMITNEEFQTLLYQSLRHLQGAASSTVTVDLAAATITVPSAFGVVQTFRIDLDRIDHGGARNSEAFTVRYTTVILAATKACLRSTMLRDCFDASALLRDVNSWDDIVYIL
ncbi:hypothetical protein BDR22DRAFT_819417 [Usnea florida]